MKLNQQQIELDKNYIQRLSSSLSNINGDSRTVKARKEQLGNFFHNLQHIDDIMEFNYRAMFRMRCKKALITGMQFESRDIGLEYVGATCYMNATLQSLYHIPELQDFFLRGKPRQEYDNRFINPIQYGSAELPNTYLKFIDDIGGAFEANNQNHINKLRDFCIERLSSIAQYKNDWDQLDNAVMEELKLILKCFPDDETFYRELINNFGSDNKTVTMLPQLAIDIGYEFFLVFKQIDDLEKNDKGTVYYSPKRFKDFLSIKNPLFKGIAANDSKDLIIFLYEECHGIYNKALGAEVVKKALKLGGDKFRNIDIARQIQKHLFDINNCLNFLFTQQHQHQQALDNIKQCGKDITSLINGVYLDEKAKEYLTSTINGIINDILNMNDVSSIPNIAERLRCFDIVAYSTITPSLNDQEFETFLQNYFSTNASIFSDEFYFIQSTNIECAHCHFEKESYTTMNLVIHPLQKVYEFKYKLTEKMNKVDQLIRHYSLYSPYNATQQQIQVLLSQLRDAGDGNGSVAANTLKNDIRTLLNQLQSYLDTNQMSPQDQQAFELQKCIFKVLASDQKTVTIQECFQQYAASELLQGANQIYCNNCRQMSNAFNRNKLKTLPKK